MNWKIIFCIFLTFSCNVHANDINLLDEYRLLYVDLLNIKTFGYKSYFNSVSNRATRNINITQGSLQSTESKTDVAIVGEGFFKIKLENDEIGYTRNGEFRIDIDSNIITKQGYFLYNNIKLPELFLPETLRITRDFRVYVNAMGERDEINEVYVGDLITYNISSELLSHYRDAIYVINNVVHNEEISKDNYLIQGFLEISNYPLLSVILRMYYILSIISENYISNIDFKKELLKVQIENMANQNNLIEEMIVSLNNRMDNLVNILIENNILNRNIEIVNEDGLFERQILRIPNMNIINLYSYYSIWEYLNRRHYYLDSILPFLKYDY